MDFTEYQEKAAKTAVFPQDFGLPYTTLGLVGEAGEIANKVKKVLRGDYPLDDKLRADLADEIGDCLWYIQAMCSVLGLQMDEVASQNIDKLYGRMARGVLKGSGDKR